MTSRPSTTAPILAVLAIVLMTVSVGLYTGGYVAHGKRHVIDVPPEFLAEYHGKHFVATRFYGSEWKARFYCPGAVVESWLTGMPVTTKSMTY